MCAIRNARNTIKPVIKHGVKQSAILKLILDNCFNRPEFLGLLL
jgi:hypothetical protein